MALCVWPKKNNLNSELKQALRSNTRSLKNEHKKTITIGNDYSMNSNTTPN